VKIRKKKGGEAILFSEKEDCFLRQTKGEKFAGEKRRVGSSTKERKTSSNGPGRFAGSKKAVCGGGEGEAGFVLTFPPRGEERKGEKGVQYHRPIAAFPNKALMGKKKKKKGIDGAS